MSDIKGFIFDLDGVIVDTAKYHYQAWRRLAQSLGFDLSLEDNERLKGISRMASLDIVLSIGGIRGDEGQKSAWAAQKNAWYVELISAMGPEEILPGADSFILRARERGLRTAIGSASKNTPGILASLGISELFDVIIDGNRTARAKPDPEVFLLAAQDLGLPPATCVVFEDAAAGAEAAKRAGMACVGIGSPSNLPLADLTIRSFRGIGPETIISQFILE